MDLVELKSLICGDGAGGCFPLEKNTMVLHQPVSTGLDIPQLVGRNWGQCRQAGWGSSRGTDQDGGAKAMKNRE